MFSEPANSALWNYYSNVLFHNSGTLDYQILITDFFLIHACNHDYRHVSNIISEFYHVIENVD